MKYNLVVDKYGNIINIEISITHKKIKHTSKRNLEIYQSKLEKETEFTPNDMLYYVNELYDHQMFEKAQKYYNKFLNSKQGWSEDNIRVCKKLGFK